jgi:general secretion pathway protein D
VRRLGFVSALTFAAVVLIGCPKNAANQDYNAGRKAEAVQDYDTALVDYERALRDQPTNAEYKLRVVQMRLQASQYHVELGERAFKKGDLQLALSEFQKAQGIDPSNQAAGQGVRRTMEVLAARAAAAPKPPNLNPGETEALLPAPPELKPVSNEPINLKMTNDSRVVFETIAKLAGLSVIFDPDFTSRRITVELPNVTLEQALDDVALESKAFWKPLSSSVIFVAPDNPQKRRDVEDEEVRTFYLSNTVTPQEITEIVTGLRQLLDLRRLTQVNAQNAIVIRDTPDKLALASKIISDIDKARPEVMVHVQVLAASVDRLRNLGILPGQTVTVQFTPECALQPTSSGCTTTPTTTTSTSTTPPAVTLNNLKNLSGADWSVTLPGAVATAIMNDNKTRLIQDPEIRVSDGEKATLTVGEKVPIATGSFQAGVGVGVGGGAGVVNPLVNTQFQYLDVGVKVDVTPRIHPDGDVSMKLSVEISALNGTSNIGGINQPIISTRKVEHDIRLKDGEASVLGGLIETMDTRTANGWPGLGEVPGLKYLFSDQTHELEEDEVLIVLTPHIVRLPSITAENLRTLAAGTDTNARVYHDGDQPSTTPALPTTTAPPAPPTTPMSPQPNPTPTAQLHFDPARAILKPGDSTTIGLAVSNVNDLFSIPLLIHYDPAAIQVVDVRDGGFLSGGDQGIAIVHSIDQAHGQVIISATRKPNTPGVNGSGTLIGIVIRGLAPGTATLQVLQVNARDSQQRTIPMVSTEAILQVQ